MKKGKTNKLSGFRTFKSQYGTIDSTNLKSIYLNIQTWVEPKKEVETWNRVVLNMSRSVKHSIYENLNRELFDDKFIVDLDLRTSGIQLKKKSFMNLEVNLYVKEHMDFKSPKLKKIINTLIQNVYSDVLNKNEYFKFYLTKKGNTRVVKTKTQIV